MKGLLCGMKALGVGMIIGTAGASGCMVIDFRRSVLQVLGGLGVLLFACILPHLGKGLRRAAVMLCCFR